MDCSSRKGIAPTRILSPEPEADPITRSQSCQKTLTCSMAMFSCIPRVHYFSGLPLNDVRLKVGSCDAVVLDDPGGGVTIVGEVPTSLPLNVCRYPIQVVCAQKL